MQQNLAILEQLLSHSGNVWLPVTMLVGLLLALIFRPNTIHNLTLFRLACWLLALSVVVTPVLNLLLGLLATTFSSSFPNYGPTPYGPSSGSSPFLFACVNVLGPIMQGLCILCGLLSLIPPAMPRQNFAGPVKHPLE